MKKKDSSELYECFLKGDESALIELIGCYKYELTLYINLYVNDIFTAEELMEDTFLKLIVKKPKYQTGQASFKTWLFSIARNLTLNHLKKQSRRGELNLDTLLDEGLQIAEKESVESEYIKGEQSRMLYRALERIPNHQRQAVWLKYFEGFSNAEIADCMGKSRRQVEALLYRARISLKDELIKEGFEYEN